MKTTNAILTDMCALLTASPINDLNGGIYKKVRPTGSVLNDCVIHIITGNGAKFVQSGAIYIKIYYNMLMKGNTYYEDSLKGQQLEQLLIDFSSVLLCSNTYFFDVSSREVYSEPMQGGINQYFVILKMNFKLTI